MCQIRDGKYELFIGMKCDKYLHFDVKKPDVIKWYCTCILVSLICP